MSAGSWFVLSSVCNLDLPMAIITNIVGKQNARIGYPDNQMNMKRNPRVKYNCDTSLYDHET